MALQQSSYDSDFSEPKKPEPQKGHGLSVFLVLVLGALVTVVAVPSLRTRVMRALTVRTPTKIAQDVTVWANKQAGYYYCSGTRFYGHGSGVYMKQGDALTRGYQPELGKYCADSHPKDSPAVSRAKQNGTHATKASGVGDPSPGRGETARRK
jgi:hypothetical protein